MADPIRWTYAFVDRPMKDFGRACGFWTAVTATELSEPRGEQGEFVTLLPDGTDACVKAQGVDAGEGGAHLDLAVEDVPALAESARRLGAEIVTTEEDLVVLRSPVVSRSARSVGTASRRGLRSSRAPPTPPAASTRCAWTWRPPASRPKSPSGAP